MDVTIDPELSAFIESQVESGRFSSADDVVREALRSFRSIEGAYTIEQLREAWNEGIASGEAGEVDFEALKTEARAGHIR